VSQGVFVDDIFTDFRNGSLQETGAPLDLAIVGEGFFVIMAENRNGVPEEMFSRDGHFTLDSDRVLLTKLGHRVMGELGEIIIPDGNIVINAQGEVFSDGEYIDRLRLVSFSDPHSLRKHGDNLYRTTDQSEEIPFTGTIEQGFSERSNVNSVYEMVDMITTARLYETNSRMIQIQDSTLQRAANDIGRK
jgi:flagellar basal-body rod protein FlgG